MSLRHLISPPGQRKIIRLKKARHSVSPFLVEVVNLIVVWMYSVQEAHPTHPIFWSLRVVVLVPFRYCPHLPVYQRGAKVCYTRFPMSLTQQYHISFIELDQATEGPVTRFGLGLISLIFHPISCPSDLVPLVTHLALVSRVYKDSTSSRIKCDAPFIPPRSL